MGALWNPLVMEQSSGYGPQRLNPKNDFLFKKLFGEEEGKPMLISLLNAILRRDGQSAITNVTLIENKQLIARVINDKEASLDLLCETDWREIAELEMQIRRFEGMGNRSLYYLSRLLANSIKSGQTYRDLKRTITINILDHHYFNELPLDKYHSIFRLSEDEYSNFKLTDAVEMHFLECAKFRKLPFDINDPLHRWLRFLEQKTTPEQLEELMSMDEMIKMAETRMNELADDQATRYWYIARERAILDRLSWELEEREFEQAKEKFEQDKVTLEQDKVTLEQDKVTLEQDKATFEQEKINLARTMLSEGFDPARVSKITGLSRLQIEQLHE